MLPLAPIKPLYLLADSQLLYWRREDGSLFLDRVREDTAMAHPLVAYIGASNYDNPALYHQIFEPAVQQLGPGACRMIPARPARPDVAFLEQADIIVLAGGSVEAGWRAFEQNGLQQLISRRYYEGVVLIGVSAGAIQLGRGGLTDNGSALLPTFGLAPFYVGAHEEGEDWAALRKTLALVGGNARGIGIPLGSGVIYQAGELAAVRNPALEILVEDGRMRESVLLP